MKYALIFHARDASRVSEDIEEAEGIINGHLIGKDRALFSVDINKELLLALSLKYRLCYIENFNGSLREAAVEYLTLSHLGFPASGQETSVLKGDIYFE